MNGWSQKIKGTQLKIKVLITNVMNYKVNIKGYWDGILPSHSLTNPQRLILLLQKMNLSWKTSTMTCSSCNVFKDKTAMGNPWLTDSDFYFKPTIEKLTKNVRSQARKATKTIPNPSHKAVCVKGKHEKTILHLCRVISESLVN